MHSDVCNSSLVPRLNVMVTVVIILETSSNGLYTFKRPSGPQYSTLASLRMLQPQAFGSLKMCRDVGISR